MPDKINELFFNTHYLCKELNDWMMALYYLIKRHVINHVDIVIGPISVPPPICSL